MAPPASNQAFVSKGKPYIHSQGQVNPAWTQPRLLSFIGCKVTREGKGSRELPKHVFFSTPPVFRDVIRREVCRVGFDQRNPKPETDSEDFPRADRNPKPETRNPKPTAKVGFKRRNPKPETRNRQRKLVSIDEARNPKPETRNRLESDFWVALRIRTPFFTRIRSQPKHTATTTAAATTNNIQQQQAANNKQPTKKQQPTNKQTSKQANKQTQTNQTNQTNQTKRTKRTNKTSKTNKTNKTNKTAKVAGSDTTEQTRRLATLKKVTQVPRTRNLFSPLLIPK